MFTGIVRSMGRAVRVTRRGGGSVLEVEAPAIIEYLRIGDSVAVNGACVTVTGVHENMFGCDLVPETLARTNLGTLQPGDEVNVELPLRAGDRLDGHLVQGHVDTVGTVRSRRRVGAQELLEVNVPFELTRYLAPKGSVAVDGVSLTVVDVNRDRFRVALIPHTVAVTTLGRKVQGQTVNVEVDVLSKYVDRHLAARSPRAPLFQTDGGARHGAAPAAAPAPKPAPAAKPAAAAKFAPRAGKKPARAKAAKPVRSRSRLGKRPSRARSTKRRPVARARAAARSRRR